MADEARFQYSLTIIKNSGTIQLLNERYSATIQIDVSGTEGPSPGALTIPGGGKVIDLSELTEPYLCVIKNRSATRIVQLGIRDPDNNRFYPMIELEPGMEWPIPLSRNFREEYQGTGTGTTSPGNQFFAKGDGGDVEISVEAFTR